MSTLCVLFIFIHMLGLRGEKIKSSHLIQKSTSLDFFTKLDFENESWACNKLKVQQ